MDHAAATDEFAYWASHEEENRALSSFGLLSQLSVPPSHPHEQHFQLGGLKGQLGSENITAVADVGVEAVILSCYLNSFVFLIGLLCFEAGRRYLPTIYYGSTYHKSVERRPPPLSRARSILGIPRHALKLWRVVFSIPWHTVLTCGGLDAYMFLRYIRLCGRVTSVSAFWGMLVLGTVYGTAGGAETGWYRMSIKNIPGGVGGRGGNDAAEDDDQEGSEDFDGSSNLRLWTTVGFMYLLTFYVTYLLSEEYKHYVELRMDYLARGDADIIPQHHYSLRIENIPQKLKSEQTLLRYFSRLFPGKVHSVSVVLNLPEMNKAQNRRERVRRRLEKAVAHERATGVPATHYVGRARCLCCGIESSPIMPFKCCSKDEKVNSVEYYENDLAAMNEEVQSMIAAKLEIALSGTPEQETDDNLLGRVVGGVQGVIKGISRTASTLRADSSENGGAGNGFGGSTSYGSFDDEKPGQENGVIRRKTKLEQQGRR